MVTINIKVITPGHIYLLPAELRVPRHGVQTRGISRRREGSGTTQIFFYYTYGYTTGYLGMWLSLRRGENAPALRMTVRMPRTDYTGVFEDVVKPTKGEERASFEDDGEDAEDNERTT